jgi:hypothetical protein
VPNATGSRAGAHFLLSYFTTNFLLLLMYTPLGKAVSEGMSCPLRL